MEIYEYLKNIIQLRDEHLIGALQNIAYIQTVSKKEKIYCEGTPPEYFAGCEWYFQGLYSK